MFKISIFVKPLSTLKEYLCQRQKSKTNKQTKQRQSEETHPLTRTQNQTMPIVWEEGVTFKCRKLCELSGNRAFHI